MEDLVLLRVLQLFDSQFPVGNFAHSGGLETYAHLEMKAPELEELLTNQIHMGLGRLDLAAASRAWQRSQDITELDRLGERLDAWKLIPSIRESSLGLGRRTLSIARRLFPEHTLGLELKLPHQAVVVGAVTRRLDIAQRPALLALAQAQLMSSLAAAVRCMPVSPAQAQEIVVRIQPDIVEVVENVLEDPEAAFFAGMPAMDIRCHQQKSLYTRLFQS